MKKLTILFFITISLLISGCSETFLHRNKVFHKTIQKKTPPLHKNKSLEDESEIEGLEDILDNDENNSDNYENHIENNQTTKITKLKSESKLDKILNALSDLNLSIEAKKVKLKKGNLLLINLGPIVHFETDKFNIKKQYKPKLDKIIKILKNNKRFILIVGHTDSVGSDIYNQKLSELRAREVYNYFLKKGISKKRIDYIGYGEEQPIATNATEEGRAKNRRVELLISKDENLSNYFLKTRKINKMYLNNHNSKLAGKVIVTKKGWSKHLSETEIKKLESRFSQPKREEFIPHLEKREIKINLKKRELIFKGVK